MLLAKKQEYFPITNYDKYQVVQGFVRQLSDFEHGDCVSLKARRQVSHHQVRRQRRVEQEPDLAIARRRTQEVSVVCLGKV